MKLLLAIVFTLTVLAGFPAFAQGRVIDESTYKELMSKASEFRTTSPFRIKQDSESCRTDSGTCRPLDSVVTEVARPGKIHTWTTNTALDGTKHSTEFINIDGRIYVNRSGTGWQIEGPRKATVDTIRLSEPLFVEYRDLGREKLDGRDAAVFLKTIMYIRTVGDQSSEITNTVKSWISTAGNLVKEESTSVNSRTGTVRMVMTYQPDLSIKFEAPIK